MDELGTSSLTKLDGVLLYGDRSEVQHWAHPGTEDWHQNAVMALRSVYDPEIPLNIYDLGLILRVETRDKGFLKVVMTLTSPSCPEAEALPEKVVFELKALVDTVEADVELSWDEPWTPERMPEDVRLELGFY